ncbi:MAG: FtsX-like permease family protein [Actinomycetota bacterium]
MLRLTIKNLLDKKIRFALTTIAVVVSVAMVVGVFVLTDSLRESFNGLAEDIASGADLAVRSPLEIGEEFDRPTVPESVDDIVNDVDGVARTIPGVLSFNDVVIIDGDGDAIRPQGPPALGFSFAPLQFFIIEGEEPAAPGVFATDVTTAGDNGLIIGETYAIDGPQRQEEFELVGIFRFGSPDEHTSLGQTMAAFELGEAQRFFGKEGTYDQIDVIVEADQSIDAVQTRIQQAVGASVEVVTAEVLEEENAEGFDEVISIFNNILLAFAFIIVFVATFIINNTFQIVVAQRIRELGLLRAIGATGTQVSRSVYLEALLVGIFSTITGILFGLLLGIGLRTALNALGFSLPAGPLVLAPRTVIWALAVGIGVTMLSAIVPARRARTISPIAAIQTDQRLASASLTRRLYVGGVMTAVGAILLAMGLFIASSTVSVLTLVAIGALLVFVGVNTLSPSFARPIAMSLASRNARWSIGGLLIVLGVLSVLGGVVSGGAGSIIGGFISGGLLVFLGTWPIRSFGLPGEIGRGNAARSPRRTASTAGALMIGLALVGMAGVVGSSLTKSFLDTLDNSVEADYFIQSSAGGFDPSVTFSEEVAEEVEALAEFDSVVRYRFGVGSIQVNGENKDVFAADFDDVEKHLDADITSGGLAEADGANAIALHEDPAADLGLAVGDTIDVTFPDFETDTLTVAAIYTDSSIFGNWLIDNATWERHFERTGLGFASATVTGFSDDLPEAEQAVLLEAAADAIQPVTDKFPAVVAENRVEFRQSQQDQLNSFLAVIFVLLALSLVIALIGIANTLALSVFERTREIGLLRAVGMSRRQLRRAIRWEAVIIAVFGAILGLLLGVVFGIAAVVAIPDTFINTVSVPYGQLAAYLVVAALAGVLAAVLPALRASRMNVLEAISHE